jgi:hypothetical protein
VCGTISMHHIHGCAWLLKSAALCPVLLHGIAIAQCMWSCIMLSHLIVCLFGRRLVKLRLVFHLDSAILCSRVTFLSCIQQQLVCSVAP